MYVVDVSADSENHILPSYSRFIILHITCILPSIMLKKSVCTTMNDCVVEACNHCYETIHTW